MTVEQSPLERFSNQKQQQPPILNVEKDIALSPTTGVIDLTNDADKEDELKAAIALSLKEHEKGLGGQVSMEDQDISRVVEASLAESKAVGTKRKRGEIWLDPLNPHDRKRNADWPVGLKNVGNTCWFSAVIQSLFHLPIFRKLVLSYSPKDWNVMVPDSKERRNLVFMQQLRKLFALLLCSKRKYVDPSHALEEFKEAFPNSSGTDSQQDVSEFTHKLLEWLEDAFKMNSHPQNIGDNGESMMDGSVQNPMLDLFYGHYLSEGQNEGRMFSNEETFGQYPLQVNGFNNIHESLEAAMAQEIESSDVMTKSGQESWFTRLPPVLLFELSRFQFNQQLGRPEKIHNKLEFPEVMYMDRYMEQNKNITRSIREKVRKLKEERDKLQNQLEKYLNYGSGGKKVPLADVLQYSLEFAESRKVLEENCSEDVEMASPASVSSAGCDSPSNSPNKLNSMEIVNSPRSSVLPSGSNSPFSTPVRVNHSAEETVPLPQHVSELELKVLQTCLKRWRKEVETNVKSLQENINNIDNTIKEIYNDPSLQKNPYRLHAVLVHEGQAASGHYWAYVYCPNRRLWLKFNDVSVTEATWTELQKDSMGGHHYASAYCLLYVDELKPELFNETQKFDIGPEFLHTLSDDLQQYVEDDNDAFQSETETWELEQSRKKDSSTMTMSDADCTIIGEKRMALFDDNRRVEHDIIPRTVYGIRFDKKPVRSSKMSDNTEDPAVLDDEKSDLSKRHAFLLHDYTLSLIERFNTSPGQSMTDAFNELVRRETTKLRRIGQMHNSKLNDEIRLQHIGVYIVMNATSADIYLNWSVLEQFLVPELDIYPNGRLIKEAAMKELESYRRSLKAEHFFTYQTWHYEYHAFRKLVTLFVMGIEHFHAQKDYAGALNIFMHCCKLNAKVTSLPGSQRGLDPCLLEHYRRNSCLKLNDELADQFEICEPGAVLDTLFTAYEFILPSMEFLASPNASEADIEVCEIVRNRWCSMLGIDLASPKQERLQDFLSKLLDPSNDLPPNTRPKPIVQACTFDLEEKFKAALGIAKTYGSYVPHQAAK